ncbi:uncharacterized protein LOC117589051 isoform X1 [Drosophila guanche]|uniref:uncharacterized protein LOC117589051 isoform X1 n=1 Tax=Drosophila guanche TaxID=7266 RepID=UPI0014725C66|nr:uncharacterized protein LOC117589051 isoform X1 [Drosophila guanche]
MSNEATGVTIKEEAQVPVDTSSGAEQAKKPDNQSEKAESQLAGGSVSQAESSDSHLQRLQSLRKELSYISETDWMYESLDKKPQQ